MKCVRGVVGGEGPSVYPRAHRGAQVAPRASVLGGVGQVVAGEKQRFVRRKELKLSILATHNPRKNRFF